MARTRTTIRRIDPWSILKFGFVVNLVLLGIELLVGAVAWTFIRRLELIESICDLAASVGFQECGVDGQALFDTALVLGLLGIVIQTGIMVFLCFLTNLIFDLTGGIVVTLDDTVPSAAGPGTGRTKAGGGLGLGNAKGKTKGKTKGKVNLPSKRPASTSTTPSTPASTGSPQAGGTHQADEGNLFGH